MRGCTPACSAPPSTAAFRPRRRRACSPLPRISRNPAFHPPCPERPKNVFRSVTQEKTSYPERPKVSDGFCQSAPPSCGIKHFQRRTASSCTRVIMPVVQDHELENFLMLATQFVLQAHDFLEPLQAPAVEASGRHLLLAGHHRARRACQAEAPSRRHAQGPLRQQGR